ncbi:MAG: PAAR-like domain-containing protein [Desulforhopalus sp.]
MSNHKKGNVLINGRTVVHRESGGVLITTDVCLTKIGKSTVPISYTNVARSVDADNTSSTVFVNGHPSFMADVNLRRHQGKKCADRRMWEADHASEITKTLFLFIAPMAWMDVKITSLNKRKHKLWAQEALDICENHPLLKGKKLVE